MTMARGRLRSISAVCRLSPQPRLHPVPPNSGARSSCYRAPRQPGFGGLGGTRAIRRVNGHDAFAVPLDGWGFFAEPFCCCCGERSGPTVCRVWLPRLRSWLAPRHLLPVHNLGDRRTTAQIPNRLIEARGQLRPLLPGGPSTKRLCPALLILIAVPSPALRLSSFWYGRRTPSIDLRSPCEALHHPRRSLPMGHPQGWSPDRVRAGFVCDQRGS
jgi:hypothetical protein